MIKPLGHKAYGSIPHLPGSRLGPGDHHCSPGQAIIACEKARDKHDLIIVQEKLDGSNVAVAKVNNEIIPLGRSGYRAETSKHEQHLKFAKFVFKNWNRFNELLNEGERVCGEWLLQAHGTRYNLPHEPFVAFDLMTKSIRTPFDEFRLRISKYDFVMPQLLSIGQPLAIETALELIKVSAHGAIDEVEGAIWRIERNGEVDFLCKYVKHDKQDGKYFPEVSGCEIVWNYELAE